ncbi:hypothetical protein ScPMuIL_000619 [Solemya velum]
MSRRKQQHPRHIESEEGTGSGQQNGSSSDSQNSTSSAANVCNNCQTEFTDANDFHCHIKTCADKASRLYGSEMDGGVLSMKNTHGSEESEELSGGGSDGEQMYDQSDDDDGDEALSLLENGDVDDDYFKDDGSEDADDNKLDMNNQLPQMMFPFSNLLPNSSNVMLEPMSATKAAVAQFAENNLPPADLAVLHSTLYNLQQQQLVQLQLIHQLQQQLLMSVPTSVPNGQPPSQMSPDPTVTTATSQTTVDAATTSGTVSPPAISTEASTPEPSPSSDILPPGTTESLINLAQSTLSTSLAKLGGMTTTTSIGDYSSYSCKPFSKIFLSLFIVLDRSQYISDDPFFKHKCRLCHKVFGSDSALQIHIRSHTGERPFKCNICGNRFSTRGNLKVHFERHKAKYPHVKMNPNPVPEHLDKTPPPVPPSLFPVSIPKSVPEVSKLPSLPSLSVSLPASTPSSRAENSETRAASPPPVTPKSLASPTPSPSEPPPRVSPDVSDTANLTVSTVHNSVPSSFFSTPSSKPMMHDMMTPLMGSYPLLSPVPTIPPLTAVMPSAFMSPPPGSTDQDSKDSMNPTKLIEHDESIEEYMECTKSETSKLQQLVDNIEHKLSDPNQCVICHRVLSCKSALQMHYRIHTGERPFKCKICSRAFTTKGNLKTHMGVHRVKPPLRMMHQCPVCHKQFTNLLVLQQHIRSHTNMTGIPRIPEMQHLGMFRSPTEWPPKPFDMSRLHDPNRELDLSKTSSFYSASRENHHLHRKIGSEKETDISDQPMDVGEEEANLKDEGVENTTSGSSEGNKSRDKDIPMDSDEGRPDTSGDDGIDMKMKKDDDERPDSAVSSAGSLSHESAGSPSHNYNDSVTLPNCSSALNSYKNFPGYSTSLQALEDRVNAIDASPYSVLSRFHPLNYFGDSVEKVNGDIVSHSRAPSESGSEGSNLNDGDKPVTPALSASSEGSGKFGYGALDLRPGSDDNITTTCNICLKAFACRSALDIHYRSHTKERPYMCHVCDRGFSTKGNMKQHMLTHKIRDLTSQSLTNSNSSDSGTDTSPTNNNNLTATNNNLNHDHDDSKHSDIKKEQLSPVISESKSPGEIKRELSSSSHVSSESNSPFVRRTGQKHQCRVCQKTFSSGSALQIHIRTHTGDKPYKCNVCGKAFTTKGNLKVHMGTHMWNNSPSRRGRRMSIEPPFMLAHKDNPYMAGFAPRAPDFYPFQFSPFMNGIAPPKMNEISVIQSLNAGMNHLPTQTSPPGLTSPPIKNKNESQQSKTESSENKDSKSASESGELDLSMKSSVPSVSTPVPASPVSSISISTPTSQPPHVWMWKTSCHLCSQSFPTPSSLEHHIQSFHMNAESHKTVLA